MTEHDNRNRGALWGNKEKKQPNHPDFKGSLNVDGVEYWVSGWRRKEGDNPKSPALRLSIQPKDDRPQRSLGGKGRPANPDNFTADDMDGDRIPF